MKANELMIGDFVMLNGSHYQIEEISKKGWVHLTSNGIRVNMTTDYLLEVLQPIPLTDAILKANGFEYRHKYFAALSYGHPFQLEMVEWPNENGIGLWMVGGLLKIRYVHELQHALRLCEIEKEIEL